MWIKSNQIESNQFSVERKFYQLSCPNIITVLYSTSPHFCQRSWKFWISKSLFENNYTRVLSVTTWLIFLCLLSIFWDAPFHIWWVSRISEINQSSYCIVYSTVRTRVGDIIPYEKKSTSWELHGTARQVTRPVFSIQQPKILLVVVKIDLTILYRGGYTGDWYAGDGDSRVLYLNRDGSNSNSNSNSNSISISSTVVRGTAATAATTAATTAVTTTAAAAAAAAAAEQEEQKQERTPLRERRRGNYQGSNNNDNSRQNSNPIEFWIVELY